MKFTLSWLKEHLDTQATVDEIAEALTDLGLEVESVTNPAAKLSAFTIGKVLSAEQHPDADRLRVCRVATEAGEVQIVCGAPNAREGITVVVARPGTYVPGIDTTIGVGRIRGVESAGMMCSEREMELGDAHDGIIELPSGEVGERFSDWLAENAGDYLVELESRERQRTGLVGLKVGYNRVHGYFIEIPRAQAREAPADYIRRQTLKNAERFIIPELKAFEDKALSAKSRALAREKLLFDRLIDTLGAELDALQASARSLAALDVLACAEGEDGVGRIGRSRRIAMLGDMLEMGPEAEALHAGLATHPALDRIDVVHCCGPLMKAMHAALPPAKRGVWVADSAKLADQIRRLVDAGDVVMVKGSLGARMARVVDGLKAMGRPAPERAAGDPDGDAD